ncbi:MAG TPA: helix-turn-helix domain-containing protein [Verrucomicrobiae bacterium]|nr:helix-turn-helix domain-containing protein [Verrucomicrobiae bacterium]
MKGMSTVAEQLRLAREANNFTVEQIAEMTKIRTDHVRALEEGNFSVFSAPVYIRGSVKNYATRMKLDVPQIMAALDEELGRTENYSEPPALTEEANKPLDHLTFLLAKLNLKMALAGAVVLGIILLVMLINSVLRHRAKNNPLTNLPPARIEPANPGNTLPLPKH